MTPVEAWRARGPRRRCRCPPAGPAGAASMTFETPDQRPDRTLWIPTRGREPVLATRPYSGDRRGMLRIASQAR